MPTNNIYHHRRRPTNNTYKTAFLRSMSKTSDGTVLCVLNLTSVPGCALNIGAVSVDLRLSCFLFLTSLPTSPFESLIFLGRAGISGTSSISPSLSSRSSMEYIVLCVKRNCSFSRRASIWLDCWLTHESTVRKRGTEERCVMKLSRSTCAAVLRDGSWGVCGACEFVQLNLLAIGPPAGGRWEMLGRFERN